MVLDEFSKFQSLVIVFLLYLAIIPINTVLTFHLSTIYVLFDPTKVILLWDFLFTTFLYIFSIIIDNCSLIDFYWTVVPLLELYFSLYARPYFNENSETNLKHQIACFLASVWGVRLTYNYIRSWIGFNYVDFRISDVTKHLKFSQVISWTTIYFHYFLIPGFLLYLAKLNLMIFSLYSDNTLHYSTVFAYLLMAFGLLYQTIADKQLFEFRRRNGSDSKKIIDEGLWYYCRHPNYFGETTFWWGAFLLNWEKFDLDSSWLAIGPVGMSCLFVFFTGPWMERHLEEKRKDYGKYKTINTSLLIPWIWRKKDYKS